MMFKKVQEGCKIRRIDGNLGYNRQAKLFIFVSVGVLSPLSRRIVSTTHAPLRVGQWQKFGSAAFYQVEKFTGFSKIFPGLVCQTAAISGTAEGGCRRSI
jgi:hypothetical protein